ncbi:MAG: PQQ-dependent sugar dehydrogenase [Pseudomonadota bacterium]
MDETRDAIAFVPLTTLPASAESGPVARVQQVVPVPGSDGLLAALDTRGVVWIVERDGTVRKTPLIDLRAPGDLSGFVEPGPESGLRSIAFHPDFATPGAAGEGRLYLAYSASESSALAGVPVFEVPGEATRFQDVVAEFVVPEPEDLVVEGGGRELLRISQPFNNHNIGELVFNPNASPGDPDRGLLFIGVGDGGGGNDPLDAGRDPSLIYGKVLRIDPLGGIPYGVPSGNPFVDIDGVLPELWAIGFRNPQQLSFDGDRLFTGDIGQSTVEEINLVVPGGDHGWDDREGTFANTDGAIGPLPPDDAALGLQYPVIEYRHGEIDAGNAAVGGGYLYRGTAIPALDGQYVFTNFPTGDLFVAPLDGLDAALADGRIAPEETLSPQVLTVVNAAGETVRVADFAGNASGRVDLRLGRDADGELLAFGKQTGEIWRLVAVGERGLGLSEEEARAVALLYETALDRDGVIDLPGLNLWIDEAEQGVSLPDIAGAFLVSDEFLASFGPIDGLGNQALVELFYENALGREGDLGGVAFWTGELARPDFDRDDLLLAFAISNERADQLAFVETLVETGPSFWSFTG